MRRACVIGSSPLQNEGLARWLTMLKRVKAQDVRVNQRQVNADKTMVGRNMPDLQFTHGGKRWYIEWDRAR